MNPILRAMSPTRGRHNEVLETGECVVHVLHLGKALLLKADMTTTDSTCRDPATKNDMLSGTKTYHMTTR